MFVRGKSYGQRRASLPRTCRGSGIRRYVCVHVMRRCACVHVCVFVHIRAHISVSTFVSHSIARPIFMHTHTHTWTQAHVHVDTFDIDCEGGEDKRARGDAGILLAATQTERDIHETPTHAYQAGNTCIRKYSRRMQMRQTSPQTDGECSDRGKI